ncbi:MAG TPA: MFS transporter [Gemmataceae bacterium]|nr:MFS transporter [Gemmataceae bacterium]
MGSAVPTRVRFGVLAFACSLSLLTYLDRVCISRAAEDIQTDLCITQVGMGLAFGAFAVGYALFEVPGGWMGDVWGSRSVLTRIVLWWSAFTALTGGIDLLLGLSLGKLASPAVVLASLVTVRFLFGCGEAGAYPNLARVTRSWFPFPERGLAQGSIWMSARLGGAMAPVVIGRLSDWLGWRQAFWVLGLLGFGWVALFWLWFRNTPAEKPECNDAERELIRGGPIEAAAREEIGHPSPPWGQMFLSLTMWALCVASFCVSFGWYFYPTWQPKYLKDVHGIEYSGSEVLTGLPFLCGAVGSLTGGRLSDRLVRRIGRRWGRSLVGVLGFAGAGLCVFASALVGQWWQAVALLCLAFFVNDLAIPPIWAVCADIGGRHAGSVSGTMNMTGAVGAVLSPFLTPVILLAVPASFNPQEKWTVVFAILASAWLVGAVAWLFIDASRPLVPAALSGVPEPFRLQPAALDEAIQVAGQEHPHAAQPRQQGAAEDRAEPDAERLPRRERD